MRAQYTLRPHFCIKKELQTGFEPVTSSLPRMRSTSWATAAFILKRRRFSCLSTAFLLSGRRGSNPPPIAWKAIALPNELLPHLEFWYFVGEGGLEPPNSSEDRFTVCCNCRYATPPVWCPIAQYRERRTPSRWRDSNPRQADYKSATLPTELHRLLSTFQTTLSFLELRLQKYYFFLNRQTFFEKKHGAVYNLLINKNL